MNIDVLRALIERRRSIRGYKTRTLQGAYGRNGGAAKYWVSDKPTAFVFRNGKGPCVWTVHFSHCRAVTG